MSTKSTFADHFSASSSGYASFRPGYPAALFEWLAATCRHQRRAWDCGTGNGQAAANLAAYFDVVAATDPSEPQIAHRTAAAGVHYAVMTAESSALADGSADLITVAQALHWFDLERFYAEVRRVLAPEGVLGVWTYGLLRIDEDIDGRLQHFYASELGPYWPAERALVDRGYADIEFPFAELLPPTLPCPLTGPWASWRVIWRPGPPSRSIAGKLGTARYQASSSPSQTCGAHLTGVATCGGRSNCARAACERLDSSQNAKVWAFREKRLLVCRSTYHMTWAPF